MYMPLMVQIRKAVLLRSSSAVQNQKLFQQKYDLLHRYADKLEIAQLTEESAALRVASPDTWAEELKDAQLAVSCIQNLWLNRSLYLYCERNRILCNVVDMKGMCNAWMMSIAESEHLVLALSSKGSCPFYMRKLRPVLQELASEHEPIVAELARQRRCLQRQGIRGRKLKDNLEAIHRDLVTSQAAASEIEEPSSTSDKIK